MIIYTEIQLVKTPDDQGGHILAEHIGGVEGELGDFRHACAESLLNFELSTWSLVPAGIVRKYTCIPGSSWDCVSFEISIANEGLSLFGKNNDHQNCNMQAVVLQTAPNL